MTDNIIPDGVMKARLLQPDKINSIFLDELQNGSTGVEFSIEPPTDSENEKMEDLRIDTAFDFDEFSKHVNLDCININDDDSNTSPFNTLASKMIDLTPDGGIKKRVIRGGSGLKVTEKAVVNLHYNSYLELEEVPFDSSYLRTSKNAEKYTLGKGNYYPGFEMAVLSMVHGEKSQFLISPKYAFGSMGIPPRIPPDATILLEIDLIKIICFDDSINDVPLAPELEDLKDFKFAFKKAKNVHLRGNDFFKNSSYKSAAQCYLKSVDYLTSCSLQNDQEEEDMKHLLMKAYGNLCICYNKLNIPQKVCIYAREAIHLDPIRANSDAKLYFNWGKALISLDLKRARERLIKAQSLDPNNKAINSALLEVDKKLKKEKEVEMITFKKALGLQHSEDKTKENSKLTTSSIIHQSQEDIDTEIKNFVQSNQSRMEFPPGLEKEEKDFIKKKSEELGLICREVRLGSDFVLALTK